MFYAFSYAHGRPTGNILEDPDFDLLANALSRLVNRHPEMMFFICDSEMRLVAVIVVNNRN